MFTMNAYTQLEKMTVNEPISENFFYDLIVFFQESFLDEIDFKNRLNKHRKPVEFLNEILQSLYDETRLMQLRPEMTDVEGNRHGYVPTKIMELLDEDRTLGNLYFATERYCQLRSKDFNTIAIHIAEYRAVNKLISKIRRLISKKDHVASN